MDIDTGTQIGPDGKRHPIGDPKLNPLAAAGITGGAVGEVAAPQVPQVPMLTDRVEYRSKTGNYRLAAMVTATVETLYRPGVEEGNIKDLDDEMHVHLAVFTPGLEGRRNSTTTPEQAEEMRAVSTPAGGSYQEFNVPYDATGEAPGSWRWATRV